MSNTQAQLKQRDAKENELDSAKEQVNINKEQLIRSENYFKVQLEYYQLWKKENKVPGIKY